MKIPASSRILASDKDEKLETLLTHLVMVNFQTIEHVEFRSMIHGPNVKFPKFIMLQSQQTKREFSDQLGVALLFQKSKRNYYLGRVSII